MKMFVNLALCGIIMSSASAATVHLTDNNFDSELTDVDTALVMFYAPWCSHCKTMKPQFEKASDILMANNPPVGLALVNCEGGSAKVCTRYEIAGYPTLKIFKNGELHDDYSGPRTANGMVKFMKTQVGPTSKVASVEKANGILNKEHVVIFGFGDEDDDIIATLRTVAENFRKFSTTKDVAFAETEDPDVMEELGHTEGVVMYRPKHLQSNFEDSTVVYDGAVEDDAALEKWINDNYHGLCGVRTKGNEKDFAAPLVVVYFNINYAMDAKGTKYWRNRVLKVAKKHPGWTYAMSNRLDFEDELVKYGIEEDELAKIPVAVATNDLGKGQKFKLDVEFSVKSFDEFLTKLEEGSVSQYLKSAPLPDPEKQGKVREVVADTFEELVANNDNDVLINFYAPWRKLTNKLVYELGEQFEEEPVDIVKMDAVSNDVPAPFVAYGTKGVQELPTLYWRPADTKIPEVYNGRQKLEDIVKFVSERSSKPLINNEPILDHNSLPINKDENKGEL